MKETIRKHRWAILILLAVLFIVYRYFTINSYTVVDVNNFVDSHYKLEKGTDGLLIPVEMKKDGQIYFMTESGQSGTVRLEKKVDENWEKVDIDTHRGQNYGFRAYVEEGTYQIKAGPFNGGNPYVEFGKSYRPPFSSTKEEAINFKVNDIDTNYFYFPEEKSHWYKVRVEKPEEYCITLFSGRNWREFSFKMKFYDDSGKLLFEEDLVDILDPNESPQKDIWQTLEPGTYYIEILNTGEHGFGEYGFNFYEKSDNKPM